MMYISRLRTKQQQVDWRCTVRLDTGLVVMYISRLRAKQQQVDWRFTVRLDRPGGDVYITP